MQLKQRNESKTNMITLSDELVETVVKGVLDRKLVADDGRKPTKVQHRKPCADCPWARKSIPGWLGNNSAQRWCEMAHGEESIDCHCTTNQQCAGAAIFRANIFKSVRDPRALVLPPDKGTVFSWDNEFLDHHAK